MDVILYTKLLHTPLPVQTLPPNSTTHPRGKRIYLKKKKSLKRQGNKIKENKNSGFKNESGPAGMA